MRFLLLFIFILSGCSTSPYQASYRLLASTMPEGPKKFERDLAFFSTKKKKFLKNKKNSKLRKSSNTNLQLTNRYWKLNFFDDFKGKQAGDDSNCFDNIEPQCHIWTGSSSYNCARNAQNFQQRNYFGEHFRVNTEAALAAIYPNENFKNYSLEDLLDKYSETIREYQKDLNKCVWTNYEFLNWMATDYKDKWSAKFDPLMVRVYPEGKGYLELRATKNNAAVECAYGGMKLGSECLYKDLSEIATANITYNLDASENSPGLYYQSSNNECPHGGKLKENKCFVYEAVKGAFTEKFLTFTYKTSPLKGIFYPLKQYRCDHNINYYDNGVQFRNLNCPIINGAITSAHFTALDDGNLQRGLSQKNGRFEVKMKIPKGKGAFPAAWLMPNKGGWPYSGGEIDIIEARDNANEIYQTYHHGKCFDKNQNQEVIYDPNNGSEFIDSGACTSNPNFKSQHLHKGFTLKERKINEFFERDHVFSVEWVGNEIRHFTNQEKTNHIYVGAESSPSDPAQPGKEWEDLPPGAGNFKDHNFPHDPFYYILNHSTWVDPNYLASNEWPDQKVYIDYVKSYSLCETNQDFCPQGGNFEEGVGCVHSNGNTTASICKVADVSCPNGGTKNNGKCVVHTISQALNSNVTYWVDADPRWPGVYYKKQNGLCPYGGSGSVNCQLVGFDKNLLEPGLEYFINRTTKHIYYDPTFVDEGSIEAPSQKCPGMRKELGTYQNKTVCKALPHVEISESKCKKTGEHIWNEYCLWNRGTWFKARRLKGHEGSIECTGGRKKLGIIGNKAVCKALPHVKIKKKKCDGNIWNNYCTWDKGTWIKARELKD